MRLPDLAPLHLVGGVISAAPARLAHQGCLHSVALFQQRFKLHQFPQGEDKKEVEQLCEKFKDEHLQAEVKQLMSTSLEHEFAHSKEDGMATSGFLACSGAVPALARYCCIP